VSLFKFHKIVLLLSAILFLGFIYSWLFTETHNPGLFLSGFFICLAIGVRGHSVAKDFVFTISVLAAVSLAMTYPGYFQKIGDFKLSVLIVPLIQLIMFGMGTHMSVKDFMGVIKMPQGVFVGLLCQFSFMPLIGFLIATAFLFEPEIAAGVVLIGSCPGGVASNVMAYIAKANLALSITVTTVGTLLSPFITPFLMKLLAGQFVPIDVFDMMVSIIKMVVIPVVAGLAFHHTLQRFKPEFIAMVNRIMPIISMAGIVYIIAIITAAGRDNLMEVGLLLVLAAVLHNGLGYILGYWGGRLFRLDRKSCRAISIEVALQNGGLASALAAETLGRAATTGLAPAIFGPWMNVSGSALANFWRKNPVFEDSDKSI